MLRSFCLACLFWETEGEEALFGAGFSNPGSAVLTRLTCSDSIVNRESFSQIVEVSFVVRVSTDLDCEQPRPCFSHMHHLIR